ncbi:hypothetical protein D9611_006945 [Ephemerocybe angulata]|uniref:PEBP-like protein n=1 Tax=Ephemerocybe angulata TaxID=980116 RepID=A0A8H5B157_9AGAR|nr:hypothetical protein D9611_006945 [Tulosesus angulatus]
MLSRTLRAATARPFLVRGNASLSSAPPAAGTPAPPPPPANTTTTTTATPPSANAKEAVKAPEEGDKAEGGRRKRKVWTPRKRPAISALAPREWNRPLAPGVVPAYDYALKYIQRDAVAVTAEAAELEKRVEEREGEYQALLKEGGKDGVKEGLEALDAELEGMREKLHVLRVQAEVNLPEVRWKVKNALAERGREAHRHLLEHRWRKDGDLDLLMERIYQMKVVPDLLPVLKPTVDLRVAVPATTPDQFRALAAQGRAGANVLTVEPGVFLDPKNTLSPPMLYADAFHADTRLYTLLMVDPDVPDPERAGYKTYLHWMCPNVELSAARAGRLTGLNGHTAYVPPHPQRGTPYHRYTVLLLPQPPVEGERYSRNLEARAVREGGVSSRRLDIPVVGEGERAGFDVRKFVEEWGLGMEGGAHMFREVWGAATSKVYEEVLKQPEPVFGRPRKEDRYADIRGRKKYVL